MAKNSNFASDSEATVFIDTSLGTHLAVTVLQGDTVSGLKRKIENEHQLCFASMGKIQVETLKVKRKGCFYHLSDSMLVKNAFSGVSKNWFLSADVSDVPRKRLSTFDDSTPLLLEGKKDAKERVTIADLNGSVDSARETSKNLGMGVKHSDNYQCTTSFHETTNRPELEIQEDHSLGYGVPTTQELKEDSSRKESDVKCNASFGKALPGEKKKQHKTKQRDKETVHLKENDASVHGFGKEQLQPDIIPHENSLGNQSKNVSCDMATENKNTTEEPSRSSASSIDNRSDSGIHRTDDSYKETDAPGEHIKSRKDTSKHGILVVCSATVEDASQPQPAAKKKRKFDSIAGLEDSQKENKVLMFNSNNETSKPEFASEISLGEKQKNANDILDGSAAESSDLLTNSSSQRKTKKRKQSSNSLNQVVSAAPKLGISLKENHYSPAQELQENYEMRSSLDVNKTTEAGNVERKSHATEEKLGSQPPVVYKVANEGGTDWAERVGEERESSQKKDSEMMMSESHNLPSQDPRDGNDAKVIVASELFDANGTATPNKTSKKKKKTRTTKDSIGETLIKSGTEHIKGSEHGIYLDEPHDAVHNEHASGKAKEEECNLSQKNGKDVSGKETESSHFVRKTNALAGDEVGTLEQIDKPRENTEKKQNIKKKSGRKESAVTENLPNLQAEALNVDHQDPGLTTDRNSKLEQKSHYEQSYGKALEPSKVPSRALEHISDGRPLEGNLTGNPSDNECSNEADNHMEVSCEGNKVNLDKNLVPSPHEVVSSGQVQDERVTRTNRADDKPKAKKKPKKLDVRSRSPSSDPQSLFKSNENQGRRGKSEAGNSSSMQSQGSLSKGHGITPHPENKFPKKVPKTGTKPPSSDISVKMTSISEVAGKHSVANVSGTNSRVGKKNEAFAVSNSKLEKPINKANQNKMINQRQSGVNRSSVTNGKVFGIDYGEVVNSSQKRKSSATPRAIFKDDSSESSEDEADVLEASIQSASDYSSSSGYSDGESNADINSPRNGSYSTPGTKAGGRSVIKSGSSGIKDIQWSELAKSSSTFKKAKLTASQSQLEEEIQPPEFVPDSQPVS